MSPPIALRFSAALSGSPLLSLENSSSMSSSVAFWIRTTASHVRRSTCCQRVSSCDQRCPACGAIVPGGRSGALAGSIRKSSASASSSPRNRQIVVSRCRPSTTA
jgi:hypothetical protein